MDRRDLLSEDERRALFGVPLDRASLAKHYTVLVDDLPLIDTKRGDANRLGFALEGVPTPAAEIAEMIWLDVQACDGVVLAPLTRDHILPLVRS